MYIIKLLLVFVLFGNCKCVQSLHQ